MGNNDSIVTALMDWLNRHETCVDFSSPLPRYIMGNDTEKGQVELS